MRAIPLSRGGSSYLGSRQWAVGNRQSAIGNRQSAIGNRQSAIGNRQSAKIFLVVQGRKLVSKLASPFTIHDSRFTITPYPSPPARRWRPISLASAPGHRDLPVCLNNHSCRPAGTPPCLPASHSRSWQRSPAA
jgi:hypothetical protein